MHNHSSPSRSSRYNIFRWCLLVHKICRQQFHSSFLYSYAFLLKCYNSLSYMKVCGILRVRLDEFFFLELKDFTVSIHLTPSVLHSPLHVYTPASAKDALLILREPFLVTNAVSSPTTPREQEKNDDCSTNKWLNRLKQPLKDDYGRLRTVFTTNEVFLCDGEKVNFRLIDKSVNLPPSSSTEESSLRLLLLFFLLSPPPPLGTIESPFVQWIRDLHG